MKTTTTTREYDADGHMVKETVTEYDSGPTVVAPAGCNCSGAIGYCPLHGYRGYQHYYQPNIFTTTTTGTTFTINSDTVAALSR